MAPLGPVGSDGVDTPPAILAGAGLTPCGPVTWGSPVPCRRPGVYVIATSHPLGTAPIDEAAAAAWIRRVPALCVDGVPASPESLSARLRALWIKDEQVVYIGRAGTNVGRRVRDFYRTPLGDPRPHAGGHWLKTLSVLDDLCVWWAESDDPARSEADLLTGFADTHGTDALPFANRESAAKVRKPHGITGSTLRRATGTGDATPRGTRARRAGLTEINAALQRMACASAEREVRAVEAAAGLERLGLLADSASRPGKPLRDLLRAGLIDHAYQEGGRWWFIRCAPSDGSG